MQIPRKFNVLFMNKYYAKETINFKTFLSKLFRKHLYNKMLLNYIKQKAIYHDFENK